MWQGKIMRKIYRRIKCISRCNEQRKLVKVTHDPTVRAKPIIKAIFKDAEKNIDVVMRDFCTGDNTYAYRAL